jgi:hypothetical protein
VAAAEAAAIAATTATDNCTTSPTKTASTVGDCSATVTVTATDECGNSDSVTYTTRVDITAPIVTITGPVSASVYPINTTVYFTNSFSDNCGVQSTQWRFDGITQAAIAISGMSGTSTTSYKFTTAGVYMITNSVTDGCGNTVTCSTVGGGSDPAMIIIYDPNGGFVTGGGWIMSPIVPDLAQYMSVSGKANFGFVSKYQKGATIPTGETEFQFKEGDMNFHSSAYDWLVISGAIAQYKGSGTINGVAGYSFLLTATDGQVSGGGGVDKLRMKIWNTATSVIVYDNKYGSDDTASANNTTPIGGGSISIKSK